MLNYESNRDLFSMSLKSMTGFSRVEGEYEGVTWYWEIRSVNGRGLDVRSRLGQGMEVLDTRIRALLAKTLSRGNVNIVLNMQHINGSVAIRLNEAALAQVIKAVDRARELMDSPPARVEGVLGLKGVLEFQDIEESEDLITSRQEHLILSFQSALEGLIASRKQEGQALADIIARQFDEIERLVTVVDSSASRRPEAIRERLKEQISRIVDSSRNLDEERLYQEAVLLATRCDVEEELKRLEQHIAAGRSLLVSDGPVGRKLDFLAQEFNREANTLCSKSNDGDVTQAGVALKVVIDQMREQVQNIE